MKRTDFLKLVATSSGGFLLSGTSTIGQSLQLQLQKIVIYDNYIRGMRHYKNHFDKLNLKLGQAVELKREPDNIYDAFAIQIIVQDLQIGYISAYENVVLANLMDKGVQLNANISKLNTKSIDTYMQDVLSIKIETQLMVPIQHLHIQDLTIQPADDIIDAYRQGPDVLGE